MLNIGLVKEICEELKIEKLVENMEFVSYRKLDYFIENIKQIKFNLPVIKLDKFKLSVFLKKEDI